MQKTLTQTNLKVNGLTRQKLKVGKCSIKEHTPKGVPIIGYTDTSTVKLDFDKTTLRKVKRAALRVCRWFKLEGFIIFKSSGECYHVVFNKAVSWRQNVSIVAWTCYIIRFNLPLMRWLVMQCIKKSSTLRLSTKGGKPVPRVLYRFGQQNSMIRNYLKTRRELGWTLYSAR